MSNPVQNLVLSTKGLDIPAELIVPAEGAPAATTAGGGAAAAASRHPALVVLHDHYGLDDPTRRAAARLSELGYMTLCPDLYVRSGGPKDTSSDVAIAGFTQTLLDSAVIADTLTAVNSLLARDDVDPQRVGVLGWGWGGAYALMSAANDNRVRVAVDIGGAITYPVQTAQQPGSPLNFVANLEGALFAAFPGQDPAIPPLEIERLVARLREQDRVGEVKVYPDAPPRFWRDETLPQTAQLWRRLTNFLHLNLIELDSYDEPIGDYENEASRLHA